MSKKLSTYSVTGKLELIVSIEVKADSLSDALDQTVKLKEEDFVEILGEFIDGYLAIIGVSQDSLYALPKDE